MAEENKLEALDKANSNYQKFLNLANSKTQEAKEKGKDIEELAILITEKTLKHQEILGEVFERVPDEAKTAIQKAIEVSRGGSETAVQAVSGEKKEELLQKIEEVKVKAEEKIKSLEEKLKKTEERIKELEEKEGQDATPAQPAIPSGGDGATPDVPAVPPTPAQHATSTPATPAIPAAPATPAQPATEDASATPATPAIPATPAVPPTATSTPPSPPQSPPPDTLGPWITNLSISPTTGYPREIITFSATAEDPSGIGNVVYDIRYPNDGRYDSPYHLRPNCNFNGATSGTCTFSETIDHATEPQLYGDYVIESVKATDILGNVSTYYPDGSVLNSVQTTHNLVIPVITISPPPPPPFDYTVYQSPSLTSFPISGVEAVAYNTNSGTLFVVYGSTLAEVTISGTVIASSTAPWGDGIAYDSLSNSLWFSKNVVNGPDLITNTSLSGEGISSFNSPTGTSAGIAYNSDNGYLYIVDPNADEVYEVTTNGALISHFDTASQGDYAPRGITYNPIDRNLIVLDGDGKIFVYTTSGTKVTEFSWGPFYLGAPYSIEFNPANRHLFIADLSTGRIVEVSPMQ